MGLIMLAGYQQGVLMMFLMGFNLGLSVGLVICYLAWPQLFRS